MKQALVTGGTKGIGLAVTKMLLAEGYAVTVTFAHDKEQANAVYKEFTQKGLKLYVFHAAQGNKEHVHSLVKHMRAKGYVDCIICNAGTTERSRLIDTTDEAWERVMQINVNSNMSLIRDLYEIIAPNARIVFMGSMMGVLPHSVSLAYGVSKAAEIALAKNLVKEFAGTGTTVNVIAPGFVNTDWQKTKSDKIRQNICNKTALGRFADPDEIAEAVRFCVKNAFINGSIIEIHGGYNYQ